jgi:hypothetical protein
MPESDCCGHCGDGENCDYGCIAFDDGECGGCPGGADCTEVKDEPDEQP